MQYEQPQSGCIEANPALDVLRSDERGFTLVEVMAATVISLMVIASGFTAVISSERALRVNDQVAQTQQNSRIGMALISYDLKMAGFGMTGAVGACTIGGIAAPIVPSDNNPAGADTGPDRVSLVVPNTNASIDPEWILRAASTGPTTLLQLKVGSVADMQAAGLAVGSTVSVGGAVSSAIATGGIDTANDELTLATQIGPPKVFPTGTQIFMLECITYQVIAPTDAQVALCGANAPCLVRGVADTGGTPTSLDCNTLPNSCVALVEGIEDLQLAYACDGCNAAVNGGVADGIPDDQNASGSFDVADFITNNTWATIPLTPDRIRLVQVSIVARPTEAERGVDENNTTALNTAGPIIMSDHDPTAGIFTAGDFDSGTYGAQRRRVLVRTVQTRNIGL